MSDSSYILFWIFMFSTLIYLVAIFKATDVNINELNCEKECRTTVVWNGHSAIPITTCSCKD